MGVRKLVNRILSISISVLIFILVVFGVYYLAQKAYAFGYRVFTEAPMDEEPGKDVLVEISEGMDTVEIAELLQKKGLIRDVSLFVVQVKLFDFSDKIKPGLYVLNTSMTIEEILEGLSADAADTGGAADANGAADADGALDTGGAADANDAAVPGGTGEFYGNG